MNRKHRRPHQSLAIAGATVLRLARARRHPRSAAHSHDTIRVIARAISQLLIPSSRFRFPSTFFLCFLSFFFFLGGPRCYNPNPAAHSSSHDYPGDLRPRFVRRPGKNPPSDASSYCSARRWWRAVVAPTRATRHVTGVKRSVICHAVLHGPTVRGRVGIRSRLDLVPTAGCCPAVSMDPPFVRPRPLRRLESVQAKERRRKRKRKREEERERVMPRRKPPSFDIIPEAIRE